MSVGLQRVNVNNPGGIDLEIDLALSSDLVWPQAQYAFLLLPAKGIAQDKASFSWANPALKHLYGLL